MKLVSEKICFLTDTIAIKKDARKGTHTLTEAFTNKKDTEYVGISLTVFGDDKKLADPIQVIDVDLKNIVENQRDLAKANLFKSLEEHKELIIYGEFADGKGVKCGKTDGTVCSGAHIFCTVGNKKKVANLISNILEGYKTTGDVIDSAKGGLSKAGLMHTGLYILYQKDHKTEIGTIEDLQVAFDNTRLKGVPFPEWVEDTLTTSKDNLVNTNTAVGKHVRQVKYNFNSLREKAKEIYEILDRNRGTFDITTWFLACTSLGGDLKRIGRTYNEYLEILTNAGFDTENKEYTKQMRSAWDTADVLHNTIGNWYKSDKVMAANFNGFIAPEEEAVGFTLMEVSYKTQAHIEPFATIFNKSRETQNREKGAIDIPGLKIPANSIVSITGRGGIGKSSIAMLMAAELIRLGKKPLVINREDDSSIIEERFSACLTQKEKDAITWSEGKNNEECDTTPLYLNLFDSDNIEKFSDLFVVNPYEAIKQIKALGIDCIMIDPFMAMIPPDAEKDNGVAATFMRSVQRGCKDHEMVLFIITHSAKGDGTNVRGSSALIDSNRLSISVQLPIRIEHTESKKGGHLKSRRIKYYNNELGDWDITNITRVVVEKNNYGATHTSWNIARMSTGELIIMDDQEFRSIDVIAFEMANKAIDAEDTEKINPPPRKNNSSERMKATLTKLGEVENKEEKATKKEPKKDSKKQLQGSFE